MKPHTIVLMRDGKAVETRHEETYAATCKSIGALAGEASRGGYCRLQVDGPHISGMLNFDPPPAYAESRGGPPPPPAPGRGRGKPRSLAR